MKLMSIFRIISASHQDLDGTGATGSLPSGFILPYPCNGLELPPLRERGNDILLLAHHFIQKICSEWDIKAKALTERAQDFLLNQYYPGNVQELRNIIERAITLSDTDSIDLPHLQSAPLRR